MKKKALFSAVLFLAAFMHVQPATAEIGWDRSLNVEWSYNAPVEPKVTGFKLYKNGATVPVCSFNSETERTGSCDVVIDRRDTSFTLTAAFSDNTESPHSPPFVFTDVLPSPEIRKMVITQSITITQ